jgi:hypothetical protein
MGKAYLTIITLLLIISCTKEKEFEYPLIITGEVTDISVTGAVFHAKITDMSKENIVEYGFVWDLASNPDLENSEKYIMNKPPETGVISQRISTTLKEGGTYYVRAFIRNNNYITYGREVSFKSLGSDAPIIKNIFYKTGIHKDTILLSGENFSYRDNIVKFDGIEAEVIKATQDTLITVILNTIYHSTKKISVSVSGNIATLDTIFHDYPENTFEVINRSETFGNAININSNEMDFLEGSIQVFFGEILAEISYVNKNQIKAVVPQNLNIRTPRLTIISNRNRIYLNDKFSLSSLVLNDFYPKIAVTGNTITLTGSNFSPIAENNIVKIGGLKAEITYVSVDKLEVKLPLQYQSNYPDREVKINVEVIEENQDYNGTLLINDQWFRHRAAPVDFTETFFTIVNDYVYMGINGTNKFWVYNPATEEYKRLSDFPGPVRDAGNGFAINDVIYFGTGNDGDNNLKDFWEYTISTDTWVKKNDFPGESRLGSITFSIDGNGYLGGGVHDLWFVYNDPFDDFWKYYSSTDSWSQLPSFNGKDSSSVFGMAKGISAVIGDVAYIGIGWNYVASPDGQDKRWFSFNSQTNTWKQLASFPKPRDYYPAISFVLNGMPYVKTVSSDFYRYNSSKNSWEAVVTKLIPNDITGIGFSIGSIAYVGIGNSLWEYDPSR